MSEQTDTLPEGWEERTCPEEGCDFVAKGPVKGRGSVGWLIGGHRHRAHGYSAPAAKKGKKAEAVTDVDRATRPALSIVRDAADGAGAGTRRGVPNAADLTEGFGRALGLTSVAVASYAVETDPTIPPGPEGEAQRDALVDYLSLTPKASKEIMGPLARLVAPTRLNRKYGRTVVDNVDAVASVCEIGTLVFHWRRYFRQRDERMTAMGLRAIDTTAREVISPGPGTASPPAAQPGNPGSPPPSNGHVVSAEEIQRMQR